MKYSELQEGRMKEVAMDLDTIRRAIRAGLDRIGKAMEDGYQDSDDVLVDQEVDKMVAQIAKEVYGV